MERCEPVHTFLWQFCASLYQHPVNNIYYHLSLSDHLRWRVSGPGAWQQRWTGLRPPSVSCSENSQLNPNQPLFLIEINLVFWKSNSRLIFKNGNQPERVSLGLQRRPPSPQLRDNTPLETASDIFPVDQKYTKKYSFIQKYTHLRALEPTSLRCEGWGCFRSASNLIWTLEWNSVTLTRKTCNGLKIQLGGEIHFGKIKFWNRPPIWAAPWKVKKGLQWLHFPRTN